MTSGSARWAPSLPAAGSYEISVFVPGELATDAEASYSLRKGDGTALGSWVISQQDASDEWITAGTFELDPEDNVFVLLDDTGQVAADAVRFAYGGDGSTPGGQTPTAVLFPTFHNFRTVGVNSSSQPQVFTLVNTSDTAQLEVNDVILSGANPDQFAQTIQNCDGATLDPGEGCTISVIFRPTSVGPKQARLRVSFLNMNTVLESPLFGSGTALTISPPGKYFGQIEVGRTSTGELFTVSNLGNTAVSLTAVTNTNTDDFNTRDDHCSNRTIAGGETCSFIAEFDPETEGSNRQGTLSISQQGAPTLLSVYLSGDAVPNPSDDNFVRADGSGFRYQGEAFKFVSVNLRGIAYENNAEIADQLVSAGTMGANVIRIFMANNSKSPTEVVQALQNLITISQSADVLNQVRNDPAIPDDFEFKFLVVLTDFYSNSGLTVRGDNGELDANHHWYAGTLRPAWFAGGYSHYYQPMVKELINAFSDEPAIFAWELGNEIQAGDTAAMLNFVYVMGHYIKDEQPDKPAAKQMVTTGFISMHHAINGHYSPDNDEADLKAKLYDLYIQWDERPSGEKSSPIDFVSLHLYNNEWTHPGMPIAQSGVDPRTYQRSNYDLEWLYSDGTAIPYVIGEFGMNGAYNDSAHLEFDCHSFRTNQADDGSFVDPPIERFRFRGQSLHYPGGESQFDPDVAATWFLIPSLAEPTHSRAPVVALIIDKFMNHFGADGLLNWGFMVGGDNHQGDPCNGLDTAFHRDWEDMRAIFKSGALAADLGTQAVSQNFFSNDSLDLTASSNYNLIRTDVQISQNATTAVVQSTNLLAGETDVTAIQAIIYNFTSLPSGTAATFEFSQDGSTWLGATAVTAIGYQTINLNGLAWSGSNFYYRLTMNTANSSTPTLDSLAVIYVRGGVDFSVNPTVHDFGSLDIQDTSPPQTFTILSNGDADLVIGQITVTGIHTGEFAIQNDLCSNQTIAPGNSCTLEVDFAPLHESVKSAALLIPTNDTDLPTFTIPLSGITKGWEIFTWWAAFQWEPSAPVSIIGNKVNATDRNPNTIFAALWSQVWGSIWGPRFHVSLKPVNNVARPVDEIRLTLHVGGDGVVNEADVLLFWAGSTVVLGDDIPLSDGQVFTWEPPYAIPLDSLSVQIDALRYFNNGALNKAIGFEEIEILTTKPHIRITPQTWYGFGNTEMGSSSPAYVFTVSNVGGANLNLGAITLNGANPNDFTLQSDTCSNTTLAPEGGCTLQVAFTPLAAGAKAAQLSIPSNDPFAPVASINLSGNALAPSPAHLWRVQVDGGSFDQTFAVAPADDGGYVATGVTYSFGSGDRDIYVVKVQADGTLAWTAVIGNSGNETGYAITPVAAGGYLIAGNTDSAGGDYDAYLVKIDEVGQVEWTKTVGTSNFDRFHTVMETSDNHFVAAGELVDIDGVPWHDAFVAKFDAQGNKVWETVVGGDARDIAYHVIETADQGYLLVGQTYSFYPDGGIYAVKLDHSGNVQWSHSYGRNGGVFIDEDTALSAAQTSDGGYILTGSITDNTTYGPNLFVLRVDAQGVVQWSKEIEAGSSDLQGASILQSADGGYIVAGLKGILIENEWFLLKLSADGNTIEWARTISGGDPSWERHMQLIPGSDGGYVLAGPAGDMALVKVDEQGLVSGCSSIANFSPTLNDLDLDSGQHGITRTPSSLVGSLTPFVTSGGNHTAMCTVSLDPDLFVSPTSHDFGAVAAGVESPPQLFTVSQSGATGLPLQTVTLGGSQAAEFRIQNDNCSNQTLLPAATCTLEVLFTPADPGLKSATLSIPPNNGGPAALVTLNGTGGSATTPDIVIDSAAHDFGAYDAGLVSYPQTLTVSNAGNGHLNIGDISLTGEDSDNFSLENHNCPIAGSGLAPGGSCTFAVTFLALAEGSSQAQVVITSDDPDTPLLGVAVQATVVLNTNLVAHWSLDQVGPQIEDDSGHSNHLTNFNAISAGGQISNAASLNGNAYLAIDHTLQNGLNITRSLTLVGWMNPAAFADYQVLASKYEYTVNNRGYRFEIRNNGNRLRLIVSDDGTFNNGDHALDVLLPAQLNTNTWYHVAAVFDAGSQIMTIYLNGEAIGVKEEAPAQIFNSSAPFLLGANLDNGVVTQFFNGRLDDWRVYAQALDEREIERLMGISPLRVHLPFEEAGGSIAYDLTNYHNHGELRGATYTTGTIGLGALQFDGFDDRVALTDTLSLDLADDFTIAMWVKNEADNVYAPTLFNRNVQGDGGGYHWVYLNGSAEESLNFQYRRIDGSNRTLQWSNILSHNIWHHVVFVKSNGQLTLYLDGELVSAQTMNDAVPVTTAPLYLGTYHNKTANNNPDKIYNFKGQLDDVRLYDYGFTAAEVGFLHANSLNTPISNQTPTIYFDVPTAGSAFTSGDLISMQASPRDYDGLVSKVEFYVGGFLVGTATHANQTGNYAITWDSTAVAGLFQLEAIVTDEEGAQASTSMSILVNSSTGEDLAAHWPFDEAGGDKAWDISLRGNHGTLQGGIGRIGGQVGDGALTFDGLDDRIYVPDSENLNLGDDFTIAMWVKNEADNVYAPTLFNRNVPGDGGGYHWVYLNGSTEESLNFQYRRTDGSNRTLQWSNILSHNIWHHVVFVKANGQLALYLDGELVSAQTMNDAVPVTTAPLYLGTYHNKTANNNPDKIYNFKGQLDDVRLYNYALSPASITSLQQVTSPEKTAGKTDGRVGYAFGASLFAMMLPEAFPCPGRTCCLTMNVIRTGAQRGRRRPVKTPELNGMSSADR